MAVTFPVKQSKAEREVTDGGARGFKEILESRKWFPTVCGIVDLFLLECPFGSCDYGVKGR